MQQRPAPKRLRKLLACEPCRQRKRKCDGSKPCDTCGRFRHRCYYSERSRLQHAGRNTAETSGQGPEDLARERSTASISVRPGVEVGNQSVRDSGSGRYWATSSAIVYPQLLGQAFGAEKAPRPHSFAWHLGIRMQTTSSMALEITQIISWEAAVKCSNQYFRTVHAYFDILDEQVFINSIADRWKQRATGRSQDFDALVASVLALGSYFALASDTVAEAALAGLTKQHLDNVGLLNPPSIDLIAAYILRTLYLRATSKPHASWMASSITMHLMQAAGLHKPRHLTGGSSVVGPVCSQKLYSVGRAINTLLSYEYSRPTVNSFSPYTDDRAAAFNEGTSEILRISRSIPEDSLDVDEAESAARTRTMLAILASVGEYSAPEHELFPVLCRAATAFAAFRRLRLGGHFGPSEAGASGSGRSNLLSVGSTAIRAIDAELSKGLPGSEHPDRISIVPWWGLITVPFHFILILLAVDDMGSLSLLTSAVQTLKNVSATFNTHLTREAVQTAVVLMEAVQKSKQRDATVVNSALEVLVRAPVSGEAARGSENMTPFDQRPVPVRDDLSGSQVAINVDEGIQTLPEAAWTNEYTINWDEIFTDLDTAGI